MYREFCLPLCQYSQHYHFNVISHDSGSNIIVAGTLLSTKLQAIFGGHQFLPYCPPHPQDPTLHSASLFFTEILQKPTGGWPDMKPAYAAAADRGHRAGYCAKHCAEDAVRLTHSHDVGIVIFSGLQMRTPRHRGLATCPGGVRGWRRGLG